MKKQTPSPPTIDKGKKYFFQVKKHAFTLMVTCAIVLGAGYGMVLLFELLLTYMNPLSITTIQNIASLSKIKGMQEASEVVFSMDSEERLQYFEEKRLIRQANTESLVSCPYTREQTINLFYEQVDANHDSFITIEEFKNVYPSDLYVAFVVKCGATHKHASWASAFCFKNCQTLIDFNEQKTFDFS